MSVSFEAWPVAWVLWVIRSVPVHHIAIDDFRVGDFIWVRVAFVSTQLGVRG
jgi:hypothetical protein